MCEMSEERTFYIRISLMFIDMTKEVLPKLFIYLIEGEDITIFLSSQKSILRNLWIKKVINTDEYNSVSRQVLNLERFDVSLWLKLIINLCKDNIPKPQRGWESNPDPKDKSLGADLLQLKDIRNKIIGHSPDAKLSKGAYESKWANIKAILLRVVELVDSNASDAFKQRINRYEGLHVNTVKRLWDELLQEKVEELIRRSQEFQVYFEAGLQRFVRYIKVLFYGGRLVLCRTLKAKLGDQDLSNALQRKKETLTGIIEERFDSCVNSQGSSSDYDNWDVHRLASFLLCNVDLTQDDIIYIKRIISITANYAALALQCLDPDDFIVIWTDLIICLNHLSDNIPEKDKQHVENLIEVNKKKDKGGCDVEECIKQLRDIGVEYDVNNETITDLRDMLEQLSQEDFKFKHEHVLKLTLLTTCKNEETRRLAEDLLKKCLQKSIQKSDEQQGPLEKEILKLLSILSAVPDEKPAQENRKRKNQSPINHPIKCSKSAKK